MSASMRRLVGLAAIVMLIASAVIAGLAAAILGDDPGANTVTAVALLFGSIAAIVGAVLLYKAQPKSPTPTGPSWREQSREVLRGLAGLVGAGFSIWLGGYAAVWLFPTSAWAYKWRYAFDDQLNDPTVQVEPKPHDCEFMTAPIGSKHCDYEPSITTVRIGRAQSGQRIVSFNEGVTWDAAAASDKAAIFVSWDKIDN